jgi:hypothetical protein
MKSKSGIWMSVLLILAILPACIFPLEAPFDGQEADPTATPEPFAAETDGPPGFSASLSAPDVVLLTWEAVPEAVGYELQVVTAGLDPAAIARLPAEVTAYEHLAAPESSLLTYRLQTIAADGPAGASSLQIATQAHEPNPIAVQPAYSENETASAVIGAAGGELALTDARGVVYTLTIPPAALNTDLEITLTALTGVDGWPLDGDLLAAVRIEPVGWLLDEVAELTVDLPAGLAGALPLVGFAFEAGGQEFHLTPSYADLETSAGGAMLRARQARPSLQASRRVIRLPIMELKVSGVGEASADAGAAMTRDHAPTGHSDAADQKSAAQKVYDDELAPLVPEPDDELAPLPTEAQLGERATVEVLNQVLNAQDCYEFKRAAASFQAWETKTAQLGDGYENRAADRQTLLDELGRKALEAIEKAGEDCRKADKGVVPESIPCAEKLARDIASGSSPFFKDLQKSAMKDEASRKRFVDAQDALSKCPHSFRVNEAAALGFRWISGCIPSLDRPFQVKWVGPALEGTYRLYPTSPFAGRMEGEASARVSGSSITVVYQGTYDIVVITEDLRGFPKSLDAKLEFKTTNTICVGTECTVTVSDGDHLIPLLVDSHRCPVP